MPDSDLPRVLTGSAAAMLGVTPSRVRTELRRGRWRRLTPGVVLTRPDEPTRSDWALAGLALSGGDAALSGWDALRLRGLGAASPPDGRVLVLSGRGKNRIVGGVHIRPTTRGYGTWTTAADDPHLPLIPVVRPARAVADTALLHNWLPPVRALVTAAIQRQLCTIDELCRELETAPRNRSAFLRRALTDVIDGARSVAEADAIDVLRRAPVPPFELNVALVDNHGTVLYVVDVLWRNLRAVLEIDSREFHFAERDWAATLRRHNALTRAGLAVTHYRPGEVRADGSAWAAEVACWLRERAAELGVDYRPDPRVLRCVPARPLVVTLGRAGPRPSDR